MVLVTVELDAQQHRLLSAVLRRGQTPFVRSTAHFHKTANTCMAHQRTWSHGTQAESSGVHPRMASQAEQQQMETKATQRKLSKGKGTTTTGTSIWSRRTLKRSTTTPPAQPPFPSSTSNDADPDLSPQSYGDERHPGNMSQSVDKPEPTFHMNSPRSILPDTLREAPAWYTKDTWAAAPLPAYKMRYNIHNPNGPRWYKNYHLIPPAQLRPAVRPPSVFSPSFPPMASATTQDRSEDSTRLTPSYRNPSHATLPTPSSSQTRVGDTLNRSRKTSQTAHDEVDLLDGTDPFGANWHHQSPYDIGIVSSEQQQENAHTRSRRSSTSNTQIKRRTAPSPLFQSMSAVHLQVPDTNTATIQAPRKLSKRRPVLGNIFGNRSQENHSASAPATPYEQIPISVGHHSNRISRQVSIDPPSSSQSQTSKREKRGSMLDRLAKKFSLLRRSPSQRDDNQTTIIPQFAPQFEANGHDNTPQMTPSSAKQVIDPSRRVPPPQVEEILRPEQYVASLPRKPEPDRASSISLEAPYSMGRLTVANPDIPTPDSGSPLQVEACLPPEKLPKGTERQSPDVSPHDLNIRTSNSSRLSNISIGVRERQAPPPSLVGDFKRPPVPSRVAPPAISGHPISQDAGMLIARSFLSGSLKDNDFSTAVFSSLGSTWQESQASSPSTASPKFPNHSHQPQPQVNTQQSSPRPLSQGQLQVPFPSSHLRPPSQQFQPPSRLYSNQSQSQLQQLTSRPQDQIQSQQQQQQLRPPHSQSNDRPISRDSYQQRSQHTSVALAYLDSPLSTSSMIVNPPTPYTADRQISSTPEPPPPLPPKLPTKDEKRSSRDPERHARPHAHSPPHLQLPPQLQLQPQTQFVTRQTETFKLQIKSSDNKNEAIVIGGQEWEVVESSKKGRSNGKMSESSSKRDHRRSEKPERSERHERSERSERYERSERQERSGGRERHEKGRSERYEHHDQDRGNKSHHEPRSENGPSEERSRTKSHKISRVPPPSEVVAIPVPSSSKHRSSSRHRTAEAEVSHSSSRQEERRHKKDKSKSERRSVDQQAHFNFNKPQPLPQVASDGGILTSKAADQRPLDCHNSITNRPTSELASAAEMNALRAKEAWEMDRLWKGKSLYEEPVATATNLSAPSDNGSGSPRKDDYHYGSSHTAFVVQTPFQHQSTPSQWLSQPHFYQNVPSNNSLSSVYQPPNFSSHRRSTNVFSPNYGPPAAAPPSDPSMEYRRTLPPAHPLLLNPLPEPPRKSTYEPSPLSSTFLSPLQSTGQSVQAAR